MQREHNSTRKLKMLVTDLDGTLKYGPEISKSDRNFLLKLGEKKILRAIATGRNLYSARKILPPAFPIDYLIFSSGAGIMHWSTQGLLQSYSLNPTEVQQTLEVLCKFNLDFTIQDPIPENHFFYFRDSGKPNPDFQRRCKLYQEFSKPWDRRKARLRKASQFLAIESFADGEELFEKIKPSCPGLKVIRTTSPLDFKSTWIEIFPDSVSKASAAQWLANKHSISSADICALGNDYNDLDLLNWAGHSFAVPNSAPELIEKYRTIYRDNRSSIATQLQSYFKL
ncbi:HAD hydrolase family protein [Candidatus Riflebacteria bacterium]